MVVVRTPNPRNGIVTLDLVRVCIDYEDVDRLRAAFDQELVFGSCKVMIRMKDLPMVAEKIQDQILAAFIHFRRQILRRNGSLALAGVVGSVKTILDSTRTRFDFYEDEAIAIMALMRQSPDTS